jgi:molybdopterin converting factor small subunit
VSLRVKLLGFPDLKRLLGGTEITLALEAATLDELLDRLEQTYGAAVKRALLDANGHIDPTVQVIRNDREWIPRDDLGHPLKDGDRVTFLLMVAGG